MVLCDDEEWVGRVGRSLGQLRGGLLRGGSGVGRLRGGLLMAVRLAQRWVVHWVGDDEE